MQPPGAPAGAPEEPGMSLEFVPVEEEKEEPKPLPRRVEEHRAAPVVEGDELGELAVPMAGMHYRARITRIQRGRYGDFVNVERLAAYLKARDPDFDEEAFLNRADEPAVRIEFIVEELGVKDSAVYRISFSPKSNFYRFIQLYGRPDEATGQVKVRVGDYIVVKSYQAANGALRFKIELDDVAAIRRVLG